MRSPELREELLARAAEDLRVRAELAASGELWEGYHPRMEAVHRANAARLDELLASHGWPDTEVAGADGAEAAWLIAQHAIGHLAFQRRALAALQAAAERGAVPAWQPAYLDDRIRATEGRRQRYGTQMDWDEHGELSPWPDIEDPAGVNARRAAAGLEPLEQAVRRLRETARREGDRPPADPAERRRARDAWYRRISS